MSGTTDVVLAGELVAPGRGELDTDPQDQLARLVAEWLAAVTGPNPSQHTIRAYRADLVGPAGWFAWCAEHGVDVMRPRKVHIDLYAKVLTTTPTARTGRPPAKATVARKISVVASWYGFLHDEGYLDAVPVRKRARPKVPNESSTRGLDRDEARALRTRLRHEPATDRAVVETLAGTLLRVSELCALHVGSIAINAGAVVMTVVGKGDKTRVLPLSAPVAAAVDDMLGERARAAGLESADQLDPYSPLFVRVSGARYTQRSVCRLLARVARAAGIKRPEQVTPHVLRHTGITLMLDAGESLHAARDVAGHAGVSTTERYDRARGRLGRTRTAVHRLAEYTAPDDEDG